MKITVPDNINANDFPGEDKNFYRLLDYFVQHRYETVQLARNNITFEDNVFIQKIEYKFNHGEKVLFANNLKTKPVGIVPILSGNYEVSGCRLTFERNGQLGVTVNFSDSPSYLYLRRNANQNIPNNTDTAIQWTNAYEQLGQGLAWDAGTNPSRIRCVTPGYYEFNFTAAFAGNATGIRAAWLSRNSTVPRFSMVDLPNNGASLWVNSGSAVMHLNATDYVELVLNQNSGAGLNAQGSAAQEVQIIAKNIEYSPQAVPCVIYVLG